MNASITLNNLHFYWMSQYILPKGETLKTKFDSYNLSPSKFI